MFCEPKRQELNTFNCNKKSDFLTPLGPHFFIIQDQLRNVSYSADWSIRFFFIQSDSRNLKTTSTDSVVFRRRNLWTALSPLCVLL